MAFQDCVYTHYCDHIKEKRSDYIPLTMAKEGEVASIKRIGGKDEARRHLENMGFVPGTDVMVVSTNSGNMIVSAKDTCVTIGGEMANKIII